MAISLADHMIEKRGRVLGVPLGLATNFVVNGRQVLVPDGHRGGLRRRGGQQLGQDRPPARRLPHLVKPSRSCRRRLQIIGVADPAGGRLRLLDARDELIALANAQDPSWWSSAAGAGGQRAHRGVPGGALRGAAPARGRPRRDGRERGEHLAEAIAPPAAAEIAGAAPCCAS